MVFLLGWESIEGFEEVVGGALDFFGVSFFDGFGVTDFGDVLEESEELFDIFGEFDVFFSF